MSEMKQTWTAEHLSTGWAIVYDRTPNGKKNEDGTVSYSLRIPVLLMSDWLEDPEETSKDIAREMNVFPDLLAAAVAVVNARKDAMLNLTEAMRNLEAAVIKAGAA